MDRSRSTSKDWPGARSFFLKDGGLRLNELNDWEVEGSQSLALSRVGWEGILKQLGIQFTKRSTGALMALCVFHSERTASMRFWPNGSWHCFGCGNGGDKLRFLSEYFLPRYRYDQYQVRQEIDWILMWVGMNRFDPRQLSIPFPGKSVD